MACGTTRQRRVPQVDGRRFLAVLEEIGARLQSGDSFFAVLRGPRGHSPLAVGAYFAADDSCRGLAVARVGYRLASKAWRWQLSTVFTKQYDQGVYPTLLRVPRFAGFITPLFTGQAVPRNRSLIFESSSSAPDQFATHFIQQLRSSRDTGSAAVF